MKLGLRALFIILLLGLAIFITLRQPYYLFSNPLESNISFDSIEYATTSVDGTIYVLLNEEPKNERNIADEFVRGHNFYENIVEALNARVGQRIVKLQPQGSIDYVIPFTFKIQDAPVKVVELAVDGDENLYILEIQFDRLGIEVIEEKITQYDNKGKLVDTLWTISYEEGQRPVQRGKIQGLRVKDGKLAFVQNEGTSVISYALPLDHKENVSSESLAISYTPIRKWVSLEQGYSITKKSEIVRYPTGEVLYPTNVEEGKLAYPQDIAATDSSIYFIDLGLDQLVRLHPSSGETKSINVITDAELSYLDTRSLDANVRFLTLALEEQIYVYDLSNSQSVVYVEGELPRNIKLSRWLVWLQWLVIPFIMIYFVYFIYWYVIPRVSLIIKQTVVIFPVVFICMLMITDTTSDLYLANTERMLSHQLESSVYYVTKQINPEEILAIQSPADYGSEEYLALFHETGNMLRGFSDLLEEGDYRDHNVYLVIYKLVDDQLYMIMDDYLDDGTMRPTTASVLRTALETKLIKADLSFDSEGHWIFATSPIMHEGQVIGLAELGMTIQNMYELAQEANTQVWKELRLYIPFVIVVLLLTSALLLRSILRLRTSVNRIAEGEWGTTVEIRTKDEVGELGKQFNHMSKVIANHLDSMKRLNQSYYRFVPKKFLKLLGKESVTDVVLGDQYKINGTVMVFKIKNIYELTGNMSSEQNIAFLNSLYQRLTPCITEVDGIIMEYIEGGFVGLFPQGEEQAVATCFTIHLLIEQINREREEQKLSKLQYGTVIHSGDVMLGIVGEDNRIEGRIISHNVQLAMSLYQLTKALQVSLLITKEVKERLTRLHPSDLRYLGFISLPQGQSVELYDVMGAESTARREIKQRTKETFEHGVFCYQEGRFFDARTAFVQVIKLDSDDEVAKKYFKACDQFYQIGPPDHWKGSLS